MNSISCARASCLLSAHVKSKDIRLRISKWRGRKGYGEQKRDEPKCNKELLSLKRGMGITRPKFIPVPAINCQYHSFDLLGSPYPRLASNIDWLHRTRELYY